MGFQTTVFLATGAGMVGEMYTDGPSRGQSYIIVSGDATNNVVGRGFTLTSQGVAAAGGTNPYVGILAGPKLQPLQGTSAGGSLAATIILPNNVQAEIISMGSIWVNLPGAANVGDSVLFDNTTGALTTIAPGADLPSGKTFAQAIVDYFTCTGAGLAVITLSPTYVIPQPA